MNSYSGSDLSQKAATGSERRRRMRFPVRASCCFSWDSPTYGLTFGTGWTLDLSSDGICLSAEHLPEPGERISVEVSLPTHRSGSQGIPRFASEGEMEKPVACGEGLVVWADVTGSRFAAELCFYFYGRPSASGLLLPA